MYIQCDWYVYSETEPTKGSITATVMGLSDAL